MRFSARAARHTTPHDWPVNYADERRPSENKVISPPAAGRLTLTARLSIFVVLLALEKFVLNFFVDFTSAQSAHGLGALVRVAQHWGFRFLVAYAFALALFSYLRGGRAELTRLDATTRGAPLRPGWFVTHVVLAASLAPLSMLLYGTAVRVSFAWVLVAWLLLATAAALALLTALAPWTIWREVARAIGSLWWYAGGAATTSALAIAWSQSFWLPTAKLTFEAVYRLLQWFIPTVHTDPGSLIIDTGRFAVSIDPVCSGLEGVGLMLAFGSALLLAFREEYIFPRALLLLPGGVLLMVALNVVRIAALVAIGHAGYGDVAVYGFHSQAGWIAFNCAAGAIALVSLRSRWFSRRAASRSSVGRTNPTAVYLMPFLAFLSAGMVSRAASSGFEHLYALPAAAALVALGYSWPRLHGLDWRFTWRGPAAGVGVFAAWILAAQLLPLSSDGRPGFGPTQAWPHALWMTTRLATTLAVAPLTEELAFRGFLLRRLRHADFESVPLRSAAGWPLVVSAVAFGLYHGGMWQAWIIAGLVYGLVFIRTERIGESLAAHATTNALIAACVLSGIGPSKFW